MRRSHVDVRSNKRAARQNLADRYYDNPQQRQSKPSMVEVMSEPNGNTTKVAGVVKFFNLAKGYGFIRRDGGQDVFVHANELRRSGIMDLAPVTTGANIEFDVVTDDKGPKATNLRMLPATAASSAV